MDCLRLSYRVFLILGLLAKTMCQASGYAWISSGVGKSRGLIANFLAVIASGYSNRMTGSHPHFLAGVADRDSPFGGPV